MNSKCAIGIVIVSYGHEKQLKKLLEGIVPQLKTNDQLIVVDNKKPYRLKDKIKNHSLKILEHDNGGFSSGCNFGAKNIENLVDVLLFLNPDTYLKQDTYLDIMREGYGKYSAWQSLLLLPDNTINSAGNTYNISGLSWTKEYAKSLLSVKDKLNNEPILLSGACLAIDVRIWRKIRGFTEEFFLYGEDVDISLKILMSGGKLGILKKAMIYHDFDFEKNNYKWVYLERNRLVNMFINWPKSLLIVTLIPNIVINMIIFIQYCINGRVILKIKADLDFIFNLKKWSKLRKFNRSINVVSNKTFLKFIDYKIDNPLLGIVPNSKAVNMIILYYYKIISLIVR